jgi:UDP-3-O-[3-hydroxymyristoyl] glucosamine N-acyltransferase
VIEAGAQIGADSVLGAHSYIGHEARIGAGCHFAPRVTVGARCLVGRRVIIHSGAVLGSDGFGFEFSGGRHVKIPQTGIVQVDDDVEIGANVTIDRARFGRTWIGEGTKIDNLVQIGHNTVIGKHCILVSGVAIAGSAVVGDYVVMAAGAGVAGHVSIGSQSTLGGRAGVTKDVPAGSSVLGFPAVPARDERRRIGSIARIPQLIARVKELETRLAALDAGASPAGLDG